MSVVLGFGLACPDKAKQVSMPAQQGFGLNDEEGCFPRTQLVSQEDEGYPVVPGEDGAFRLAAEDDHLLAQEGVLPDQIQPGARHIGGYGGRQGLVVRPSSSCAAGGAEADTGVVDISRRVY
jgi:hypothetical protein